MTLAVGARYPARLAGTHSSGDPLYAVAQSPLGIFWARLTGYGGAISPFSGGITSYFWRKQDPVAGGTWIDSADGLSGANSYEVNNVILTADPTNGAIVEMWAAANIAGEWRFQACCPVLVNQSGAALVGTGTGAATIRSFPMQALGKTFSRLVNALGAKGTGE